jgi:ribonuclease P protein component
VTIEQPSGPSTPPARPTLQAHERVRRRADFEQIYAHGAKRHGRFMTVFVLARAGDAPGGRSPRLGVAATRKLGGAVVRNRAKRLSRELFRRHKPDGALDVVVVPRREFATADFATLERDYLMLLAGRGGDGSRREAGGRSRRAR